MWNDDKNKWHRKTLIGVFLSSNKIVDTTLQALVFCSPFGKGDKERRVYFDAKTKIHLKEYLDSREDDNPALFVTLDAPYDRLKISGVEIRVRNLGRSLGMNKIHPHKFRRSMATRAIDKGMPIEQVQKILGHSQIDTTMQYAIVNQNNVKTSHQKFIA